MSDELILAAAGSGKSRRIINEVFDTKSKAAIITYTISNLDNLRNRIIKKQGFVLDNLKIITWFGFLLRHGIKPYANYVTEKKVRGIEFVQSQSAVKYRFKNKKNQTVTVCYKEDGEFDKHFFNSKGDVYTDKLSKLFLRINKASGGKVINRLQDLFDVIYIDEVQDLASHDLDVIKLLLQSRITVKMVGDPRQVTYLTHYGRTHKKYREGKLANFILEKCKKHTDIIDYETLNKSFRCQQEICNLASLVFPEYEKIECGNQIENNHAGVFTVAKNNIENYIKTFNPVQLRNNKTAKVSLNADTLNFGISKGLTFDRVLIFPTGPILKWLNNNKVKLPFKSRCNLYVALTRARFSVCILSDKPISGLKHWT